MTQEDARRTNWQETLGGSGVEVVAVASGGEALAVVRHQYLDAIVLDLRLADIPAMQLLEEIQKHEAEVRREFPFWKWRAVMDLLSKDKEMAA